VSATDQYLTISQAARRLGVSDPAMRRRVHGGELPLYTNPADKRVRLIRQADLDAYAVPKPAASMRGHAGADAEPRPP